MLRVDLSPGRHQGPPGAVALADDLAHPGPPQGGLDALLDEGARLLHHQDPLDAAVRGEAADRLPVQRPDDGQLQGRGPGPEQVEGLGHVDEALARGHDPQGAARIRPVAAVELVEAHVGLGQGRLALHQLPLHGQGPQGHDDGMEALDVPRVGQPGVEARRVAAHRAGAVADRGDELEGGDHAEPAAQGDGVGAEAQDLLDAGGVEDRHPAGAQGPVARPRGDRALGAVVLAAQQDHGAAARSAGEVGEPGLVRDPHGAVGLAVPEGVDVSGGRVLAAEHGRGRGLLVDPELVDRAPQLVEQVQLLDDGQVETAERRALVAADVCLVDRAARIAVVALLVEEQPDDRLDAGEEEGAVPLSVLVGERRRQGRIWPMLRFLQGLSGLEYTRATPPRQPARAPRGGPFRGTANPAAGRVARPPRGPVHSPPFPTPIPQESPWPRRSTS